jgi:hypothetical protein
MIGIRASQNMDDWHIGTTAAHMRRANTNYLCNEIIPHDYTFRIAPQRQPAAGKSIVVGFAFCPTNINEDSKIMGFNSDEEHVTFYQTPGGSVYCNRSVSTRLCTSKPNVLRAGRWQYFEIKAYCDNSNGSIDIRLNGKRIAYASGVDTRAGTDDETAYFGRISVYSGTADGYLKYSDFYVTDGEFLGEQKVIRTSASSNWSTAWTPSAGNNYECVDEAEPNEDTDYVETRELDAVDTLNVSSITADGAEIRGVAMSLVTRKTDSGKMGVSPVFYDNPVSYVLDDPIYLASSNQYYTMDQRIWDLNPADSQPWEDADINGNYFGYKLTQMANTTTTTV